jgi:hypothetical protein
VYEVVVEVPTFVPLRYTSYPATPLLPLAALQEIFTLLEVSCPAVSPPGTLGGVQLVHGAADVEAVIVPDWADVSPEESYAATV